MPKLTNNSNYREALNAFDSILALVEEYDENEHENEHEKCIVVDMLLTSIFQNADNGLSALQRMGVKYG